MVRKSISRKWKNNSIQSELSNKHLLIYIRIVVNSYQYLLYQGLGE